MKHTATLKEKQTITKPILVDPGPNLTLNAQSLNLDKMYPLAQMDHYGLNPFMRFSL